MDFSLKECLYERKSTVVKVVVVGAASAATVAKVAVGGFMFGITVGAVVAVIAVTAKTIQNQLEEREYQDAKSRQDEEQRRRQTEEQRRRQAEEQRRRQAEEQRRRQRQIEERRSRHYMYTGIAIVIVFSLLLPALLGKHQQRSTGSGQPQKQHGKEKSGKQVTRQSNEAQSLDRSPTSGELLRDHVCSRLERDVIGIERMGSKRGEHVINNDIWKVYEKIIRSFIKDVMADDGIDHMINSGRLSKNSKIMEAIDHPLLADKIKEQIANNMVVHFPNDMVLVDKNSDLYGQCIEKLRHDVVDYMKKVWKELLGGKKGNVENANLRETVELMIEREHFVDKEALNEWMRQGKVKKKHQDMFEEARKEVVGMFKKLVDDKGNHVVSTWVKELFDAWEKKYHKNFD